MKEYLAGRKSNTVLEYGLLRRAEAVIRQFQQVSFPKSCIVLDIGTADGLVLRSFAEHYGLNRCIGMDVKLRYLRAAKENVARVVQADGRRLPFCQKSVDVIILTAVLKHVRGLNAFLKECHRVLRQGGRLVVTDPTPFGIRLGLLQGYFSRKSIIQILGLEDTQQVLTECGFTAIRGERFMISPIPFTGCDALEGALKRMHLDYLFLNQIVCAECSTQ